jgi:hypothetical protein
VVAQSDRFCLACRIVTREICMRMALSAPFAAGRTQGSQICEFEAQKQRFCAVRDGVRVSVCSEIGLFVAFLRSHDKPIYLAFGTELGTE